MLSSYSIFSSLLCDGNEFLVFIPTIFIYIIIAIKSKIKSYLKIVVIDSDGSNISNVSIVSAVSLPRPRREL